MNLSDPIEAVVPTLDSPVLRVLASTTEPASARELHRRAGIGSEEGVRRVLNRLATQGLVSAVRVGASVQFRLNTEHVAYPAVERLVMMRQELFSRIGTEVATWEPSPTFVGVYGSVARGDGDEDSDIDVLVVTSEAADEDVSRLAGHIETWTGNVASVMVLTPSDLRKIAKARERIVAEWRRDLIAIRGDVADLGLR